MVPKLAALGQMHISYHVDLQVNDICFGGSTLDQILLPTSSATKQGGQFAQQPLKQQRAIAYKPTNPQNTTASSQQLTYNIHSGASSHQAPFTGKNNVKQVVCSWLLASWHNVRLVRTAIPSV